MARSSSWEQAPAQRSGVRAGPEGAGGSARQLNGAPRQARTADLRFLVCGCYQPPWTVPLPCPCGFRQQPSSLCTFPLAGTWLRIALGFTRSGFPDFDCLHPGGFPPGAQFSPGNRCSVQLSYRGPIIYAQAIETGRPLFHQKPARRTYLPRGTVADHAVVFMTFHDVSILSEVVMNEPAWADWRQYKVISDT